MRPWTTRTSIACCVRAAGPPSTADTETLREIVRGARRAARPSRGRLPRWAAVAGCGVVAAVSIAAAVVPLSNLSTEPGVYRAPTGIRLTWTTSRGSKAHCFAQPEYKNVTDRQQAAIAAYLGRHDYGPLTRRRERDGAFAGVDTEKPTTFDLSRLTPAVEAAAQEAADSAVGPGAPKVLGLAIACGAGE